MTTQEEMQATAEAELLTRKHQLETALAAVSMHGVETPHELQNELVAIQSELARRISQ